MSEHRKGARPTKFPVVTFGDYLGAVKANAKTYSANRDDGTAKAADRLDVALDKIGGPKLEAVRKVRAELCEAHDITRDAANRLPLVEFVNLLCRDSEQKQPAEQQRANPTEPVECHVTLRQMAAMVNKSKKTLERLRDKDKLPTPAVKGGEGKADEWRWTEVRAILESEYNRNLPEVFPADRFIRR